VTWAGGQGGEVLPPHMGAAIRGTAVTQEKGLFRLVMT
jgi:hypothetical protein